MASSLTLLCRFKADVTAAQIAQALDYERALAHDEYAGLEVERGSVQPPGDLCESFTHAIVVRAAEQAFDFDDSPFDRTRMVKRLESLLDAFVIVDLG